MKRAFLLCLVFSSLAGLCGCSEMSPDDREFFGRGWIHPSDLDKERSTKMPSHPETSGSLGALPTDVTSSAHEQAWGAPDRY